jgi:transcriptional regulator with XRE-family HTH domain
VTSSVFSAQYNRFRILLNEARQSANLTQSELAKRIGRPQSFVSKFERGERRLDVVEFLEIAEALSIDVPAFLATLAEAKPAKKRGAR